MLAFPMMLVDPAEKAGMRVPDNPDDFDETEYPHFFVFCQVQLGSPMPTPVAHWDNAKVVAELTEDEIKTTTFEDLIERGLQIGYSK